MKTIKKHKSYRLSLKEKLTALGLDVTYIRAEGDYLYQKNGDFEVEILDFVGAYGANLLGHFHKKLIETLSVFFKKQAPIFAQGSVRKEAEELNDKLREIFGNYTVILTNTGAETVETAVKHAFLENGKTRCWAIKNAYHGKSLGTLPFSKIHNRPFKQNDFQIDFIDPDEPETWEAALSRIEEVSFSIVEPIRGEGGVIALPTKFVDWLNLVTEKHNIPIIVDEIQTGLGRTGQLLASDQIGLRKDYICLSKALSGGIVKIGALLVSDKRFVKDFSILNTSTFADDGFSSTIAKRVLEIILEENLSGKCAEKGAFLKEELLKIQDDFPTVIKEVRGEGLMLGIEFQLQKKSSSNLLRIFSETEYFGYAIAGYLLHEHRVRVMPTLNSPNTLRVQPSAYVTQKQMYIFLKGLRSVCEIVSKADAGCFLSYLVGRRLERISDYRSIDIFKHEAPSGKKKVAFLGHLITAKDLALWDKSFENWSVSEIEKLISRTAEFLDPVIFDQVNVRTPSGETVHLNFIGMFLDSREIEEAYRSKNFHWIIDKIQHAANIAENAGCQVLGLGGFTSILTKNGKRIKTENLKLTTGNSLTVGMGIEAIRRAAKHKNMEVENSSIAIIGAGGNIANTYTEILSRQAEKMILISRTLNNPVVEDLKNNLLQKNPSLKIEITDQIEAIKTCEIVIASSNSSHPVIFPEHLSPVTKIICDLAVPPDVDKSVGLVFPDLLVIKGGIIRLPAGNDFIIGGIPLPSGHVFACMGETLVMGLDNHKNFSGSIGTVCPQSTRQVLKLAEKFGFELGALKMEQSF
jgi:acetylornithine/succinyldiaminopimelate/putrescine aminotransferase/predicted amino acid dehydrogenase